MAHEIMDLQESKGNSDRAITMTKGNDKYNEKLGGKQGSYKPFY